MLKSKNGSSVGIDKMSTWRIYEDPKPDPENPLLGFKGNSKLDLSQPPEATIYAPYIPDFMKKNDKKEFCHPKHMASGYDSGGARLCRRCGVWHGSLNEPWREGLPEPDDTIYFQVPGEVLVKSCLPFIGFYWVKDDRNVV